MDFPALPSFYTDSMYTKGQDDLYGLGTDLMAGRVPDYYKSIGESGGPEFENMLRLNTEDIQRTGYESAARMGTRGGATQSNIMKNVRSMAAPLRWADFTRSLQGREGLLDKGINMVTGTRNAGLNFGGQKNSFNISTTQIGDSRILNEAKMQAEKKASEDAMWSSIISGALGAAGTIGGAMIGGPAGAMVGGSLGSAAGKSISGGGSKSGSLGGFDDLDFYSSRMYGGN